MVFCLNRELREYSATVTNVKQNNKNGEKQCAAWLRFIVIFWSPRVLKTALKFGTAAFIMNRYERLGFAVLMLCFAL